LRLAVASGVPGRSAREHAQTIIRDHWDDIERLAAALVEKGALNGQEVHDLVTARGK
jgi:hypothetical protein